MPVQARYKTNVLWHFHFLRPTKVTLGDQGRCEPRPHGGLKQQPMLIIEYVRSMLLLVWG
jgi:hypothetical protein